MLSNFDVNCRYDCRSGLASNFFKLDVLYRYQGVFVENFCDYILKPCSSIHIYSQSNPNPQLKKTRKLQTEWYLIFITKLTPDSNDSMRRCVKLDLVRNKKRKRRKMAIFSWFVDFLKKNCCKTSGISSKFDVALNRQILIFLRKD